MTGWSWFLASGPRYGNSRAVVMLVHGLGEHVGRYDHVAAALTKAGYTLAGSDLRGHGKSGGRRGHTPSYEALLDDIASFTVEIEKRHPGQPLFLYGHSLGANLVLNYAMRRKSQLLGVIASGPWLELAFEPPAWKLMMGRLMNRIYPAFSQYNELKSSSLAHDWSVANAYDNDFLVHNRISARTFITMYELGLWALEHAAEFPLPVLLLQGGEDQIVSPAATQKFAERAGDKATLKVWDKMFHEVHNEAIQVEVFKLMVDWLEKARKN